MKHTIKCSCGTVLYNSDKEPDFSAITCPNNRCKKTTNVRTGSTYSPRR